MRHNSNLIQKMPMLSISEWTENRQIHELLVDTSSRCCKCSFGEREKTITSSRYTKHICT